MGDNLIHACFLYCRITETQTNTGFCTFPVPPYLKYPYPRGFPRRFQTTRQVDIVLLHENDTILPSSRENPEHFNYGHVVLFYVVNLSTNASSISKNCGKRETVLKFQ